ncbi:MAG: hypothetical protein ACRDWA_08975 [Acidimicrobiia bacterium]
MSLPKILLVLMLLTIGLPARASNEGLDLGGDFGTARASARQLDESTIELTLELETEEGATVVGYLIEPGDGQGTYPLVERSDGVYRVSIEVRRVNYVVVFELIKPDITRQSQPLLLTDLGVRPSVLGMPGGSGETGDTETDGTRLWGWAGLGLGALALLGVVIWAWPERKPRRPEAAPYQRENLP